jgi:hypothetical protein
MKKSIINVVILLMIVVIVIVLYVNTNRNDLCYEVEHRGVYPANPYCERCGSQSGIIQHECKNPNGEKKYCRVCGKIISNK